MRGMLREVGGRISPPVGGTAIRVGGNDLRVEDGELGTALGDLCGECGRLSARYGALIDGERRSTRWCDALGARADWLVHIDRCVAHADQPSRRRANSPAPRRTVGSAAGCASSHGVTARLSVRPSRLGGENDRLCRRTSGFAGVDWSCSADVTSHVSHSARSPLQAVGRLAAAEGRRCMWSDRLIA